MTNNSKDRGRGGRHTLPKKSRRDGMFLTEDVNLLSLGHRELYFLLGLAVAASATWFLGLFDPGTTLYD